MRSKKKCKQPSLALLTHICLQAGQLFGDGFDSLSEDEIIPFSGVSKSGAGCIIHAGGAGRSIRGTSGVELQPLTASNDIAMQTLNGFFRISQFSGVFGIQCSDITLARLHIFDGVVSQAEILGGFISLVFVVDGVVAVMVNRPGHGN